MFESDRYNELVSSAFETAYADESEKLAQAAVLARGASTLPKALGYLGRFFGRQRFALGGGIRGAAKGTPEYLTGMRDIGIPGAKALTREGGIHAEKAMVGRMMPEATKQTEKGIIPRVRELFGQSRETQARRLAERLAKEEIAKAQLHQLGGGTYLGSLGGLAKHPLQTMSAGYRAMSPSEKAMMAGFGAYSASELAGMQGKSPEEKAKTIATAATDTPLWLATGGLSMLPGMVTWMGGSELAGRGAEAATKKIREDFGSPTPAAPMELTPEEIASIRTGAA